MCAVCETFSVLNRRIGIASAIKRLPAIYIIHISIPIVVYSISRNFSCIPVNHILQIFVVNINCIVYNGNFYSGIACPDIPCLFRIDLFQMPLIDMQIIGRQKSVVNRSIFNVNNKTGFSQLLIYPSCLSSIKGFNSVKATEILVIMDRKYSGTDRTSLQTLLSKEVL